MKSLAFNADISLKIGENNLFCQINISYFKYQILWTKNINLSGPQYGDNNKYYFLLSILWLPNKQYHENILTLHGIVCSQNFLAVIK